MKRRWIPNVGPGRCVGGGMLFSIRDAASSRSVVLRGGTETVPPDTSSVDARREVNPFRGLTAEEGGQGAWVVRDERGAE